MRRIEIVALLLAGMLLGHVVTGLKAKYGWLCVVYDVKKEKRK